MSIKPILFNTEMVRAILDGKKTVTRRLVPKKLVDDYYSYDDFCKSVATGDVYCSRYYEKDVFMERARYQAGDILYVRETWTQEAEKIFYRADFESDFLQPCETLSGGYPIDCVFGCLGCVKKSRKIKWKPSIHMPKKYARIWLKVTDIRAERLQDITEEQAIAEGTPYDLCGGWRPTFNDPDSGGEEPDFIVGFSRLWDSTVKEDWQKWESNPWVWVIEFERCEKPEEG